MNILYICHRIPFPPNKGDKIRSFNEIKYLSRFHDIDLAALVDNPDDFQYKKSLEKYCKNVSLFPINPVWDKIKSLFFILWGKPLSVGYFYSIRMQKTINRWLHENSYDAVVCFSSPMAEYLFASPAWKTRFGNKCHGMKKQRPGLIMDFCDVDSDKWRMYSLQSAFPFNLIYGLEYKLLLKYEKKVNKIFDWSVFVSIREADLFYKLYPGAGKVRVVSNGVDHRYFSPSPKKLPALSEEGPVLVFTGAMDYHANVDGVLWFCHEIFPAIREKYDNIMFYIVGSNPDSKVRDLKRIKGVRVTGFVKDIRPYYEMADICVIPLRIARGVQNKVLEAMSMGKAVVTTSTVVKGINSGYEHSLLIADTSKDFIAHVLKLLANDSLRQKSGKNARNYVTGTYSWEINMKKLDDLIPS